MESQFKDELGFNNRQTRPTIFFRMKNQVSTRTPTDWLSAIAKGHTTTNARTWLFYSLATIVGLSTLLALFLVQISFAAVPRQHAPIYSAQDSELCEDKLANTYLKGRFLHQNNQKLSLIVGRPSQPHTPENPNEVWGLVLQPNQNKCSAICKVMNFERFNNSAKPAKLELVCSRNELNQFTLSVTWQPNVLIALKSISGNMEWRSPLSVEVDRYTSSAKKQTFVGQF